MEAHKSQDGAREELRQAIREMQVAAAAALTRRLNVRTKFENTGRPNSDPEIQRVVGDIKGPRPSFLTRFFGLFGRH
jgi:hypothetical protein